jgi:hypothetical protein
MAAAPIDHASIEAITTPNWFLHRTEGTGERRQVCAMGIW